MVAEFDVISIGCINIYFVFFEQRLSSAPKLEKLIFLNILQDEIQMWKSSIKEHAGTELVPRWNHISAKKQLNPLRCSQTQHLLTNNVQLTDHTILLQPL